MNAWFAKNLVYRGVQFIRREKVLARLEEKRTLQGMPADQLKQLQLEKLRVTLIRAGQQIPYYRELFARHDVVPEEMKLPDEMAAIPLLTKEPLQSNPDDFAGACQTGPISRETTSGTLGNPLVIAVDRNKSAMIRAVMFRNYALYGIGVGDRQARFWGIPTLRRLRYREFIKDSLANRIRLSAFEITEEGLARFARKLRRFKPAYLYGYPSLLYKFSLWMKEHGEKMDDLPLKAVITSGELLHDFQRTTIRQAFHCSVVNEYGTTETGIIAFECPAGNLHINSDHVFLESIQSAPHETPGVLVVTELNNTYNPLIRYRLGDLGCVSDQPCACGSGFPVLQELAGREGSFIKTPDRGQHFSALLSYTFTRGIKQFQAVQNSQEELCVKIVPDGTLNSQMLESYKYRLAQVLGDQILITFDLVTDIEPESSGKLRYFISNIKA